MIIAALAAAMCLMGSTVAVAGEAPLEALSSPTLMVTASGSTTVGLQVFANVNFSGGSNPTGTLTFKLFSPSDTTCASTPVFTSAVAVTGTSVNSDHYTTISAGTLRWQASYSGDANNAATGPTPCASAMSAVIVGKAYSNVALTAQAPVAGTIAASTTVMGYGPTGTVTFYLSAPGDTFCNTTVFTSNIAVNGNGTYASSPYTFTVGGQYKWRAQYSGDNNNQFVPVSACLDANAAVTVAAPPATFTYPAPGQANVDTSQAFAWSSVPAAQGYRITVGTTAGGSDLVSSTLSASQTSYVVPPLPTVQTLYASVYTEIAGTWGQRSITFTAAAAWATFTNPVDGQANVDTTSSFRWQPSARAQAYLLTVGTSYGGWDLLWSGVLPASQTSFQMPALPTGTLYALIYTEINGTWYGQPITFTAAPRH